MARLTSEEKALLARILEAEDDEDEEQEPDEPADEFTYQGKRYVYSPEELEEVQQEESPAPVKPKIKAAPRTTPVARKSKAVPQPESDPEPEEARRRFHT